MAFLFFALSFFQLLQAQPLDRNALRACAELLSDELTAPSHEYSRWELLQNELKNDAVATVLVRLDASRVASHQLRNRVHYAGLLSPDELVTFRSNHRTLFFVVHGSRENLTAAAKDMSARFPSEALTYRILLSQPTPYFGAPEFIRAAGLSIDLAEAIDRCFYSICETTEAPPPPSGEISTSAADVTIVTKEVRDRLISFLRGHASTPELERIKIEANFGLLALMEDIVQTANPDISKIEIKNEFAATSPKKSDGAGFRNNHAKAVERVLSAWLILIKHLDESLLADPFSAKTFFLLDQVYHARKQDVISLKGANQGDSVK